MSKRTARKILTLVTSIAASAGAAHANSETAKPPTPPQKWTGTFGEPGVVMISNVPYLVMPNALPVSLSYEEFGRYLGETQPLVGPDGRPGCGNILTKGETGCNPAREQAVAKRLAAAAADPKLAKLEAARDEWRHTRDEEASRAVEAAKIMLAEAAKSRAKSVK